MGITKQVIISFRFNQTSQKIVRYGDLLLANFFTNELVTYTMNNIPYELALMKVYINDSILKIPINEEN